jgi:hypothetical protein
MAGEEAAGKSDLVHQEHSESQAQYAGDKTKAV